jgi:hypothetical protein
LHLEVFLMVRSPVFMVCVAALACLGPGACVETSGSNSGATGGRSGVSPSDGGAPTSDGGSSSGVNCGNAVDTANDGTAGTASTGPYTWKSVTIRGGGFVDGIIFSPIQRDRVFARTDMGGAYRFDAALNGWVPLLDWISRNESNWIGVESIAADPQDPDVVYMAAGTYLTAGNGVIMRSTDAGASFTVYPIAVPMGGNSDGRSMGERLAIDPNLTSTLYFGSRANGLLRSTDSGATWQNVVSFPVLGGNSSGGTQLGLSFVVFDPTSGSSGSASSVIYVGVADVTAGSNLYVSRDAGENWQLIDGGPSAQMPHHAVLDATGKLYLVYNNGPGPNGITAAGVWTYDTASGQWQDITPSGLTKSHGFGGLSVDASAPGTAVVSTIDMWPDQILRTTDGGSHWTEIGANAQHNPNGAEWLRFGATNCAAPSYSGWMGDIEIDPFDSNHVMYVTGQGVWSTNDVAAPAASDRTWTFEDRNLEQTAVTDMVSSVNGAFLSCVGDIAGMRHEDLSVPAPTGMYDNPVFGNCTSLDFAANDPSIVVRAGNPSSANPRKYGAYSRDNARTWAPFASLPVPSNATCSSGGKLALSADGSSVVWSLRCTVTTGDASTSSTTIAVSSDMGASWTPVVGVPAGASIAADRRNPAKFYAYAYANNAGAVYVSTDSGKTFAAAQNTAAFLGRGVIRAMFGVEGDVWIVASSGSSSALYHSTQSGDNFLPAAVDGAYAVGFGKAADGQSTPAVYLFGQVAGTLGFFRSDDLGRSWSRLDDDRHQFGTAGYIAGDENVYGRVYIGTNGRGIVYGDPN